MEYRSSIGIFQNKVETPPETKPITPAEVFEAAKEVLETKGTKIIKNRYGVFVVCYSNTGPFNEDHLLRGWLPIKVYVLRQWGTGGIQEDEMLFYEESLNAKPS